MAHRGGTPYPELALLIKKRRTQLGLTQQFVTDMVGMDQTTLARWENGQRQPSGPLFERLRLYLRLTDDEIAAALALPDPN